MISAATRNSCCWVRLLILLCPVVLLGVRASAQSPSGERTFTQSRVAVEKAWKQLQRFAAGRLPSLEGFATSGNQPLERFQRGYYQCSARILPGPSGGTQVRMTAKITAWYVGPDAARSGYQVLPSNGRLEADLLDRLQEALEKETPQAQSPPAPSRSGTPATSSEPSISAPMPRIPESELHRGLLTPLPAAEKTKSLKMRTEEAEKHERELAAEAKSLEEILQNQAHPGNLVAVKRDGTPILQSPRVDGQPLFNASSGDEFEILEITADWVHVRVSGLSRGWIRKSSLELPDPVPGANGTTSQSLPVHGTVFRVTGQQFAPFPGDWPLLRGKTVEILSIQKAAESGNNPDPRAKLEFARALLAKEYAAASSASGGIVLIFDSEDGGMVAATAQSLQQWTGGKVTDQVFWQQCFFDPPQILGIPSN